MSVKNFKFVSPGVFINEIDNSFIPKSAEAIGPVVIGRATRGLAMQPVKVESYSEFVNMFGDTVPGGTGGDVYRDGNYVSPMYGTYAAKAFLRANVAPLTYVRLLGQQDTNQDGTTAAQAGWKTANTANQRAIDNGGAYGLWLFPSSSIAGTGQASLGTGSLAAIWYLNSGSTIELSGTVFAGGNTGEAAGRASGSNAGVLDLTTIMQTGSLVTVSNTTTNLFTVVISGSNNSGEKITFGFDDTSANWAREKFNTNPQLAGSSATSFYPSASVKDYWLGETYEQELRDNATQDLTTGVTRAVILAVQNSSGVGPSQMLGQASREGRTGWFIGQDVGTYSSYVPFNQQKLFRLIGRGHGEWLQNNIKVSIEKINQSPNTATQYGTFSVVLRQLRDTDNNVVVMERFDNLTLDPTSPNYVARRIGDKYTTWDETARTLKTYGEYNNQSKFVYVEMNADVDAGASDATLLPFGYFAGPRFASVADLHGTGSSGTAYVPVSGQFFMGGVNIGGGKNLWLSASVTFGDGPQILSASLTFPQPRLRVSASDGGLSDPTKASFGFQTTRTSGSTRSDPGMGAFSRLLYAGYADGGGSGNTTTGVDDYSTVFSLDNIASASAAYFYQSGSRVLGTSISAGPGQSYKTLLDAGYDSFTAEIWGGFDGLDIMVPDPMYNNGMAAASSNTTNSIYYTWKRAIDTVADPEVINMNLLGAPGLTHESLTTHMINVCEDRADAMSLIDLPNVYIPNHEQYYSSKADRLGATVTQAVSSLRDRSLDSSYGATFYPWVQTRDENTGALLWIPPSVAMMGVLASSEKKAAVWFAPAGFNRGGLTDGAAGIPVVGVTQRVTSKERDTLYEASINPIASFPSTGIVVFGQKTLQQSQSALDRINVRRLVIFLKKQISVLATRILFEQNVQATWNRFKSLVEPFLANVKTQFGITDYKLILDESTTTPDLIDQNIMYAKIMIKPARAIEYIAIDFVIMSTGASFDD